MGLNVAILPAVVTNNLLISFRFKPYEFLSRCKFRTLTTRQPIVEFYLLTYPRFPLRAPEYSFMEITTTNTIFNFIFLYHITVSYPRRLPSIHVNRVGEEDRDHVYAPTAYTTEDGANRSSRAKLQTVQSFTYLGGAVTETLDMSVEIARQTRACWMRIKRYLRELYDQPKVALSLKTRMVKAEAIEALLYGSSTWTLRQEHYAKIRTVHHRVFLRIIGAQRKIPDHRMTLYNRALEITRCVSIETMLRTRRLLWAGTLIRMSGGRLPKRIMFGNLECAVRRGRGGKEKEWTDCVQSDIRAFGITGDWKAMALKAEVWVEAVTEGGRRFMAAWRKEEENAARHRQEKREATRLGKLQSYAEA